MSDDDTFPPLVLTVPELAKILGIGRNQAYDAVRRGEIPSIRVGRRILISTKAIEYFLDAAVIDNCIRALANDSDAS